MHEKIQYHRMIQNTPSQIKSLIYKTAMSYIMIDVI